MAHHLSAFSLPLCNSAFSTRLQPCMPPISLAKSRVVVHAQQSTTTATKTAFGPDTTNIGGRQSVDYKPAIWNFDHIQSLRNDYTGQSCERRANKLKEQVRVMVEVAADDDPLIQLQLIDMLQRLEVFNVFKDETGKFKACLSKDTEGMLSLYQASYYLTQGETILEEAKAFATKYLKQYLQTQINNKDQFLAKQVSHALELPLHWRVPRLETRWFIELCDNQQSMVNPILIELAKLDFNMLQAVYQEDLKYVFRWDVNAIDHLPDYMKLCFLALHHSINEIAFDWAAPVILLHVYATATNPIAEEVLKSLVEYPNIVKWSGVVLRLANNLKTSPYEIKRGDVPKIIQCYIKETGASEADAREHIRAMHLGRTAQYMYLSGDGHSIEEAETKDRILSLNGGSTSLSSSNKIRGYKPSLKEYIENASIFMATPVILVHAFATATNPITEKAMKSVDDYPEGETYSKRAEEPKEQVRAIIEEAVDDPLLQLNLIDTLQRLGLSYHFQDHIHTILKAMHNTQAWRNEIINNNLYATALDFRLLRQHGYWVPQEVFNGFKEGGTFKACLSEDTEGMLSLYEASYHSVEGESTLEEAKDFTTKHLKQYIQNKKLDDQNEQLSILVTHALELPLHWRTPRLETRWFIDVYHTTKHMNPIILELANLDYNMVQSTHQEDLKHAYRDRLVENFLWSMEMISEPQFGYCRRMSTRILSLITTIDDIYDLYGTLDELELFTNAVQRWDMNEMDGLPDYMKLCFLALHNSINEMAFDEAKLYYSGYTPTLQEYIENAWVSISAPLVLVHAYFFLNNPITQEELQRLEEYSGIIRSSAIVLRLADDLGTSSDELKRGDVPKAMQCYMHESCASEEDAYEHIKFLIEKMWKKMNEDSGYAKSAGNIYSETFIRSAMNLTRMAQCIYLYGDGYGVQDRHTKDNVLSSVIEPIPL
ncbi:hypothetical protein FEM48_Zijuj03G0196800 [Ziziphus jujuba var. spinosa]|uniref:Uncharacterized protein n=1 Tax=Ziziphus jujuba var. spinosa TaxID=714518 RepID=A0A978VS88_ZIZJJ|nr:hypothetical protein FEM48_Zijuj03G0196800 [Ziziphus jujuba var. spinosa]